MQMRNHGEQLLLDLNNHSKQLLMRQKNKEEKKDGTLGMPKSNIECRERIMDE